MTKKDNYTHISASRNLWISRPRASATCFSFLIAWDIVTSKDLFPSGELCVRLEHGRLACPTERSVYRHGKSRRMFVNDVEESSIIRVNTNDQQLDITTCRTWAPKAVGGGDGGMRAPQSRNQRGTSPQKL